MTRADTENRCAALERAIVADDEATACKLFIALMCDVLINVERIALAAEILALASSTRSDASRSGTDAWWPEKPQAGG